MTTAPRKRPGRPAKAESDRTINFSVRMPHELRQLLEAAAATAGRSTNAEIVYRLSSRVTLEPDPKEQKRAIILPALLDAVAEVIRWYDAVDTNPEAPEFREQLKSAMEDLEAWHTQLERLDKAK